MDEKIRTQVQLPKYHANRGKIWAWCKSRPLATLIGDVFQARVEANADEIDLILNERAKDLGITPDELRQRILNDNEKDE